MQTSIDPGELRQDVAVERNVASGYDDAGQAREDWRTIGRVRAKLEHLAGSKLARAQGIHAEAQYGITLRWVDDLRETDRLFLPRLGLRLWPVEIDRSDPFRLSMWLSARAAVMAGVA